MPASMAEMVDWARQALDQLVMPDTVPVWSDGTVATPHEALLITALVRHEAGLRAARQHRVQARPARRKAYALLRSLLTPEQNQEIDRRGNFHVIAPSGRIYRFFPGTGEVSEMARHGKRYYETHEFCLHPEPRHALPDPDVTLTQLMLLSHDEAEFRERANITPVVYDQLWNGAYLRRLRAGRRRREARLARREARLAARGGLPTPNAPTPRSGSPPGTGSRSFPDM